LDYNGYEGFYINARTDTYFQKENPFPETAERAKAYEESGASGIFIPGLTNGKELEELGVKRLSFGNALFDKAIELLERDTARIVELSDTSHLYGK
jgi:2-methylisocitrate lyase-like PEP mutase family enzyme